jgi:hypothetical protein
MTFDEIVKSIPEEVLKGLKHLHIPLGIEALSVLNNTPHLESCYLYGISYISQISAKVPLLQRLHFKPPVNVHTISLYNYIKTLIYFFTGNDFL